MKKLQSSLAAYGDDLLMVLVDKALTREEEDGRSGRAPSSPRRPTSSAVGGVCCRMRVEHLHSVIVVSYLIRSFFCRLPMTMRSIDAPATHSSTVTACYAWQSTPELLSGAW